MNAVTPKYVCTLCSARKDDGGADDSYFENCDACSNVDTCTSCSSGFIRYNSLGCILHCADDPDYGTTKSYESSDGKCVTSCKDGDDGKAINLAGAACVATCADEAFMDTSGADNECKLCEDLMTNCIECSSATACIKCENPNYLKVSK